MRNKKTQIGFTLIEILIVVAIIGMLSAIVLTALGRTRSKGRDTKRKSELVQLQKALELYYNQNNAYPNSGGFWRAVANGSCPGVVTTSGASGYIPDLAPTYLLLLPTDPKPATAVNCSGYAYKSDGVNYKLISSSPSTLGNGGPELTIDTADSFYDVCRPGLAYAISNKPSVTNVVANCATW